MVNFRLDVPTANDQQEIPAIKERVFRPTYIHLLYLIISLSIGWFYIGPYLFDDYAMHNDVRQSINWFAYRWPDAFARDDLLIKYSSFNETPVITFLYRVGTSLFEPIFLGKLLTLIVFSITCAMLGWMVFLQSSFLGGLIAIFIVSFAPPRIDHFYGLFSHSFFPLLMLLAMHWVEKEWKWHCALLLALSGLFYPPAFIFLSVCFGLVCLLESRWRGRRWTVTLACFFLSGLALLSTKYLHSPSLIGPLITSRALQSAPEMTSGGRYHFFPPDSLYSATMAQLWKPYHLFLILLLVSALPVTQVKVAKTFWYMLGSVAICYLLAAKFLPYLYLPDRYTEYSLPYLAAYLFGIWCGRACLQREQLIPQAALLALVVGLGINLHRGEIFPGYRLDHYHNLVLYEALRETPKGSLVAAPPYIADEIPVYAHRSVLFNYELSHAWFPKYYSVISRRTDAFFKAYYSSDTRQVKEFLHQYHVDYLVVSFKHFEKDYRARKRWYFKPWDAKIKQYMRNGPPYWWERSDNDLPLYFKSRSFMVFKAPI